jgi:hypothetical protein
MVGELAGASSAAATSPPGNACAHIPMLPGEPAAMQALNPHSANRKANAHSRPQPTVSATTIVLALEGCLAWLVGIRMDVEQKFSRGRTGRNILRRKKLNHTQTNLPTLIASTK